MGLASVGALAAAYAANVRYGLDPHGNAERCQACHLDAPPEGLAPPAANESKRNPSRYPLRYGRERAVCERCHVEHNRQTHPVEVKPSASLTIPEGWPLDAQGQLMCSTCHDPHQARGEGRGARDEGRGARGEAKPKEPESSGLVPLASSLRPRPSGLAPSSHLLRSDKSGSVYCRLCHGDAARGDSRAWHRIVVETAHGGTPEEAQLRVVKWGMLDPLSTRCLSCHDGTMGQDVGVRAGGKRLGIAVERSHPVGVVYRPSIESAGGGREGPMLRDLSQIDSRIRLFDGKIGCGTCHDLYSTIPKLLVLSQESGRLCRACHKM